MEVMPAVSISLLNNEAAAALSVSLTVSVVSSSSSRIQFAVFSPLSESASLCNIKRDQHHLPASPSTPRLALSSAGRLLEAPRAPAAAGSALLPRLNSGSVRAFLQAPKTSNPNLFSLFTSPELSIEWTLGF